MPNLTETHYMSFPFAVDHTGPKVSGRKDHVRQQIEQVLFTSPGERVFRPQFGAGARQLVFEPNNAALTEVTRKRLTAALVDVLQGEVDPKSLNVDVAFDGERLEIVVSYRLATIGESETHVIATTGAAIDG